MSLKPRLRHVIALVLLLVEVGLFVFVLLSRDDIIVTSGIATYKVLTNVTRFVIPSLLFVLLASEIVLAVKRRRDETLAHEQEQERQRDPLAEFDEVKARLSAISQDGGTQNRYRDLAISTVVQMNEAWEMVSDYESVAAEHPQPIIQNVNKELRSMLVRIMTDAKSIHRRLVVEKDAETVESKLHKNAALLNEADGLIVQALNYIDLKDGARDVDVTNLTEALKELIALL